MAAIHKLVFDDFLDDFDLIGIHCSLEDYRLAYLINSNLKISLKRTATDHDLVRGGKEVCFSLFEYEDKTKHVLYQLVSNVSINQDISKTQQSQAATLFAQESNRHFLIPEHKCDYFLKITCEYGKVALKEIIFKINEIRQVISVYSLAVDDLKSVSNLIFD